jgi:hypothetical protein
MNTTNQMSSPCLFEPWADILSMPDRVFPAQCVLCHVRGVRGIFGDVTGYGDFILHSLGTDDDAPPMNITAARWVNRCQCGTMMCVVCYATEHPTIACDRTGEDVYRCNIASTLKDTCCSECHDELEQCDCGARMFGSLDEYTYLDSRRPCDTIDHCQCEECDEKRPSCVACHSLIWVDYGTDHERRADPVQDEKLPVFTDMCRRCSEQCCYTCLESSSTSSAIPYCRSCVHDSRTTAAISTSTELPLDLATIVGEYISERRVPVTELVFVPGDTHTVFGTPVDRTQLDSDSDDDSDDDVPSIVSSMYLSLFCGGNVHYDQQRASNKRKRQ